MTKIMMVEDEDVLWHTYASFLRRKGYETIEAADGLEAIKLFEERKPEMVFLDFFIPELRGDKVFEAIRKIDPSAKIFFVTGSKAKIDEMKRKNVPANGFFMKPLFFDDFLKIIEENK